MTVAGWLEILLFIGMITALTPLAGAYLTRVFRGEVTALGFVERPLYRLLGVDAARGQDWKAYARSVLIVSVGFGVLLDTFVVRTLLVPAAVHLIGDRVWWPSTLAKGAAEPAADDRELERV